jgi:hypothetical protein
MRALACAAIALVTIAVSGPTAFGQAGSTGGTLGNTDKSISGERREEPTAPKSRPHRSASAPAEGTSKSSGCGNVVGTYKWVLGGTTVIKANGTTTHSTGPQGKWTCANGQVTIVWNNGFIDHLTPTPSGFSVLTTNTGIQFEAPRL